MRACSLKGGKGMFHAKRDPSFVIFIIIMVIITVSVFFIPLVFDKGRTIIDIMVVISLAALSSGLLLWCFFDIKYVFNEDHLYVKGGMFRSKIPYGEITRIAPATDFYTGYRILSSKDAIEIDYKKATLGSVKISPADLNGFIAELEKRCPHLSMDGSSLNKA
jgi:Bacterial PH domain